MHAATTRASPAGPVRLGARKTSVEPLPTRSSRCIRTNAWFRIRPTPLQEAGLFNVIAAERDEDFDKPEAMRPDQRLIVFSTKEDKWNGLLTETERDRLYPYCRTPIEVPYQIQNSVSEVKGYSWNTHATIVFDTQAQANASAELTLGGASGASFTVRFGNVSQLSPSADWDGVVQDLLHAIKGRYGNAGKLTDFKQWPKDKLYVVCGVRVADKATLDVATKGGFELNTKLLAKVGQALNLNLGTQWNIDKTYASTALFADHQVVEVNLAKRLEKHTWRAPSVEIMKKVTPEV